MRFPLFQKEHKVHHHIVSGLLISLVAINMAFGIDHMLAASQERVKKSFIKVMKVGSGHVQSTDEGLINCGKKCIAEVQNGTVVTLIAIPETGFEFKGWGSPECKKVGKTPLSQSGRIMAPQSAKNICTVVVKNGTKSVTAVFAKLPKPPKLPPIPAESRGTKAGIVSGEMKPRACKSDAKICADGTSVGRTGPKCEFVCPEEKKAFNSAPVETNSGKVKKICIPQNVLCAEGTKCAPTNCTSAETPDPIIDEYTPLNVENEEIW